MGFPILGANTALIGDFVTNSLRINYNDAPKLVKTGTSAGSTTFTFSAWVKFTMSDTYNFVFCAGNQVGLAKDRAVSNNSQFYLNGATGGTYTVSDGFNRDPSAWYHLVVSCNSGTGIIYVNNENRKGSINIPQLADDLAIGHFLRTEGVGTPQYDYYCDGYMAEVHFVDGSALNPSSFAETNDNGVWVPKDCKDDLTYGSNGFYLQFKETGTSANASGIGADTSGNDNHFTPTNLAAIDITTDTPQNNFATLNPLSSNNATLSEGNVEGVRTSGTFTAVSTIAPSNGKWYFEFKNTAAQNSAIGVVNLDDWPSTTNIYDYSAAAAVLIESNANYNVTYGNTASSPTTLQNSADLVTNKYGLAMDIDNNDLYVSANGNWYGGSSFNQSDFSNATAVTTDLPSNVPLAFFVNGSIANTFYVNFGNPGGDDSISSGNADANGYGNFEYAPPSGYYSLCTKNLAEYG